MTIEVSNILIQLSMFTEYSNIVWQLKTEIILMHNWQCLLNTPILYDNWRQKLYSYNCQCLLNTPILYDNWSQQYTHTIVNVYWILQYCMTIEVSNILIELSMFTEYSNIVWQLKTEIILMHNWQCLLNTPILYDNCRQKLYLYNCQCWLNTPILYDNWRQKLYAYNCQCLPNTPILYDNWRQKLYSCTIDNEVSNILIQLSMFTEYSNIVWQLKTEIIPMHNWQCLLNTLQYCITIEDRNYAHTIVNVY